MPRIVVIDNGGQFTHLEYRMLREMDVEAEMIDNEVEPDEIDADGIVLSGGPSLDEVGNAPAHLEADVPVLGICLGMQLMAAELGGKVGSGTYGGYADVDVRVTDEADPLLGSLPSETRVWASHQDEVKTVPDGFTRTATSDVCDVEAMSDSSRDLYGVQWHPEVAHTERGREVFENFIELCSGD